MRVEPYLSLGGRGAAAIAYYQSALGAELLFIQHFRDAPVQPGQTAMPPDAVMHATLRIGESLVHVSDGDCTDTVVTGVHLSIQAADVAEGGRVYAALADGGEVRMPFGPTFWSPGFAMLKDRYGVAWMVNVALPEGATAP